MKKFQIAVPSGIGDYSWIHSKISTIPDAEFEIFVPDSYPQRTKPFIDLLPNCKGSLGKQSYQDILTWGGARGAKTWEQIVKNHNNGEDVIYLQCNEWLGEGRMLGDWLPDLKTDFHYKMNIDFENKYPFPEKIKDKPKMAITMASMRGIRAWNAWLPETWYEFIKLVKKDFPDMVFVFLGGHWDIDTMAELAGLMGDRIEYLDLVGMTTITEAIKVVETCEYMVGYSSGLTVMRTVVNKPGVTLWPKHQAELMYSWADPAQVNKREYMGFIYDSAERIYTRVKNKVKEAVHGA